GVSDTRRRRNSTSGGVSVGFRESSSAAAPATYGLANEVPDAVIVPPSLTSQVDVTATPGAQRLTQGPKLLNDASTSLISVAPTVMTPLKPSRSNPAAAGDVEQAFIGLLLSNGLPLPAATAYTIPDAAEFLTAAFTAGREMSDPRLRFATAGLMA